MSQKDIAVALVGIGKIARDQHVPSIAADPRWRLAATLSRHGLVDGIPAFTDLETLLADVPEVSVVSLCTPPTARFDVAAAAMAAGRHVMLEKPPAATLAECHAMIEMARAAGVTLFCTWHSRHAHAVAEAADRLRGAKIYRARITWKEDVRRWHPGQDWIWQAGGLGVLDPGINALSILTAILPMPVHLTEAELSFPDGRDTPIAVTMAMRGAGGAAVEAVLDWRQDGPQSWDIEVDSDAGHLRLSDGGAVLHVDDMPVSEGPDREYAGLYARMAELIDTGASEADLAPLVHVADAFMLGKRVVTDPFDWEQ